MNFILSLLANVSLFSADATANSNCVFFVYEPEMPESVKKLNKLNKKNVN